jgi:CheY-like chemotaxis protein
MKPIVLFIEDDKDQISIYKTKFELEGFVFCHAANGSDGIAAAKANRPNLIFLDLVLPDENGLDVLKKLKRDDDTKDIPTVLFTNLSNQSSREQGEKLGAIGYLVKTDINLKDLIYWAKENVK